MNSLATPPESDEAEISLFGPGYGECVVAHLGNNDWIIIDSCIEPSSKKPASLHYLEQLEINPSEHVSMIIASHWHDDHIRGLSGVLAACPSAELVLSQALEERVLVKLIETYSNRMMAVSSGCDEISRVFEILRERKIVTGHKSYKLASSDKRLSQSHFISNGIKNKYEIWSLSPSDDAVLAAIRDVAKYTPDLTRARTKEWLPPIYPNKASVVIFINWSTECFLFGADLENSDTGIGWDAIFSSNGRPQEKACYIKIPHHGSITGHFDPIWSDMLHRNAFASLTPFENGNVVLPKPRDIERINSLTTNAFITTTSGKIRTPRRHHTVQRTTKETVRYIRQVNPSFGHFRYRIKIGGTPSIELFGDARHL